MAAAVLAKITAPDLDRVVERESCFRILDKSLQKQVVWVSAPGGSGKTTLAASYLKSRANPFIWYHMDDMDIDATSFFYYMTLAVTTLPLKTELPEFTSEYFNNVKGFAVRYFKQLFAGLKDSLNSAGSPSPFIIVFDNYQNLHADSIVHDVIARGIFSLLPEGFAVVVISRGEPPIEYAEIRRNDALGMIDWNDLLFTLDDTVKLVRLSTESEVPEDTIRQLHKKMDGWAAGLTLAIERGDIASFISNIEGTGTNEAVFDYFATAILEQTEPVERECLLKTAYFREFSLPMAEKLTGCGQTHKILSKKHRQFFLTQKQTDAGLMFQYHDLFQDFLRIRAKDYFNKQHEAEIARRAVDILEENGHFETAAQLCIDTSDIERLSSLMLKHTPSMIAQGRGALLVKWFAAIPSDFLKDQPWLLYWKGMNKLQSNPDEARKNLETAYVKFKSINDPEGLFSTFCAIVDTYVYEWKDFHPLNNWIHEFHTMAKRYKIETAPNEFPEHVSPTQAVSTELRQRLTISIFSALMFRQPTHPNMPYWEEQALKILRSSQNLMQLMSLGHTAILYYLWTGKIYDAGFVIEILSPIIEKTKAHILAKLMFFRSKALYLFYTASFREGRRLVEEGLKLAEEYDIHMLDSMFYGTGIYNSLAIGDNKIAEEYLNKMESALNSVQCYGRIYYHNVASLVALSQGNYLSAIKHAEVNLQLIIESGLTLVIGIFEYIAAYVLTEAGRYDEARLHIKESIKNGIASGSILSTYNCSMLENLISVYENDEEDFINKFIECINISRTMGLRFTFFLQSSMARLCKAAMERNIEPDFINKMIRDHEITPGDYKHENWPYPLKIYTLGRFAIEIDGRPVKFSGKTQKKPLEMLKAVIALGGKAIGITQLSDVLWPDANGDTAAVSYRTTLHRLRKLLSTEYDIIISSDSYISINHDYCWVDIWALQDIANEFRQTPAVPNNEQNIYRLYSKAVNTYKGSFLPGDQDQTWAAHHREQLRDEFVNICCKAGTFYECISKWDKGIECYKSAIEADNLREECYRRTIAFYLKAGLKPEAITLYNQCKHVFETQLGISPSAETIKLVDSIIKVK
ncbi:BTAD domain-containing putative transcriptional regulator [Candidatus Magnetominusculus xianensis]|uniref:Transcriptional activator domain-containing protein n=1 Tax=Candidatus Magnetominusculus xianensis TaxID=1748249 RepID=A0ABR5SCS1_9BACT|nr:BTAD domain-containing putative transcriptional regulator [Candidatus Magnetominusculus xianensis]KWT76808.1 transcriptional activator domain-containing protein [Candidatus Magnetominusculus xianensis]MBF0402686.1 hypothetical protein [Nitrospirota bacterium]